MEIINIVLRILLTGIVYLILPLLYIQLYIKKHDATKVNPNKVAIILAAISCVAIKIPTLIIYGQFGSLAPALIWGYGVGGLIIKNSVSKMRANIEKTVNAPSKGIDEDCYTSRTINKDTTEQFDSSISEPQLGNSLDKTEAVNSASATLIEQLETAKELHEKGILSDEEYKALKKKLLDI